jgi:hypothetical protein
MRSKKLKLPVPVVLRLPKTELSAREAMKQLEPMTGWLKAPWAFYQANYSTSLRMEIRGWGWDFRYLNTTTRAMVNAYLYSSGNAGIGDLGTLPLGIEPQKLGMAELPEKWLDSSTISALVANLAPPRGFVRTGVDGCTLRKTQNAQARWTFCFSSGPPAADYPRYIAEYQTYNIELDAVTGEVQCESIGRPMRGEPIIRTVRERIRDGEWHDVWWERIFQSSLCLLSKSVRDSDLFYCRRRSDHREQIIDGRTLPTSNLPPTPPPTLSAPRPDRRR